VVKGDWPDDFHNARVARCITRKCIDVVALVDGMCWVIEIKLIAMVRAITGSGDIQGERRQRRSRVIVSSGAAGQTPAAMTSRAGFVR